MSYLVGYLQGAWRVPAFSALAYVNEAVARVLMVVVGGLVVGGSLVGMVVVGVVVVGVVVVTLVSGPGQPVHSHRPRQALKNGHVISLPLQNLYVATLFKLFGWAGWPAPCALHVSNQSGRI